MTLPNCDCVVCLWPPSIESTGECWTKNSEGSDTGCERHTLQKRRSSLCDWVFTTRFIFNSSAQRSLFGKLVFQRSLDFGEQYEIQSEILPDSCKKTFFVHFNYFKLPVSLISLIVSETCSGLFKEKLLIYSMSAPLRAKSVIARSKLALRFFLFHKNPH